MTATVNDILDYWFSDEFAAHWFSSTPEIDIGIAGRFEKTWEQARKGELDEWQQTAEGCLALIILLDQMPLNMFRGLAKSFSTESQAIAVAKYAIQQAFDEQLTAQQSMFVYMPLMHSENSQDQALSVNLFEQSGLENNVEFAKHHQSIIMRFGRFPHRNEILGRTSSQLELDYLDSDEAFKG